MKLTEEIIPTVMASTPADACHLTPRRQAAAPATRKSGGSSGHLTPRRQAAAPATRKSGGSPSATENQRRNRRQKAQI